MPIGPGGKLRPYPWPPTGEQAKAIKWLESLTPKKHFQRFHPAVTSGGALMSLKEDCIDSSGISRTHYLR